MISGGAGFALHRDLRALLPSAKYAYDKNRRNENRYDDGNKAEKKSGLRGQGEHQAVICWAAVFGRTGPTRPPSQQTDEPSQNR